MTTAMVNAVQASTFLKGATDLTLRKRLLMGWLDKAGRINRNATGKDWNWKLRYKSAVAQSYQAFQNLNFANDNYWIPAVVTPVYWCETSGMDITERLENTGPSMVVDAFGTRIRIMAESMEQYVASSLYMDANGAGAGRPTGLATVVQGSTSIACTTADRLRAPENATYAGFNLALQSNGGTWSKDINPTDAGSGVVQRMCTHLPTDWPDGHGDASQAYDGTSPRLYNENSGRWADPTAAAAASSWRTNCIAMLSRANTDLRQNSIESMMPNIHVSAAQRHQDVKDKLREIARDLVEHAESTNLGYHDTLSFEGAALTQDFECPADRTYSLCAESMDIQFYPSIDDGQMLQAMGIDQAGVVTGGIYTLFGPTRIPGTLTTGWIMFAGGQTRFSPKWVVCHKDWTYVGGA